MTIVDWSIRSQQEPFLFCQGKMSFLKKAVFGLILSASIAESLSCASYAATLRSSGKIYSDTVHLSDIFDGISRSEDRALGPSPSPGKSIQISGYQLIAIADQYGVDWDDQSSSITLTLTRDGKVLGKDYFANLVKEEISSSETGGSLLVNIVGLKPVVVASDDRAPFVVSDVKWDKKTGQFSATAYRSNQTGDGEDDAINLKGEIKKISPVMVYDRSLPAGYVLTDSDFHIDSAFDGQLPLGLSGPSSPDDVVGMSLSKPVASGSPVIMGDLRRSILVHRGDPVIISYNSPGIRITTTGKALADGGKGQLVHAINMGTKMILLGRVNGNGEISVDSTSTAVGLDSSEAKKLRASQVIMDSGEGN
ncbi:flagellar basal body P-ring formation chaperone FlgA [Acetobacter pasteurianus]|nr:flagellar basal body P-ring formation chaperone FlgA [Acetobacter pasteurianus]